MTTLPRRLVPFAAWLVVALAPMAARAATFYVAPTGSDTNAGTMDAPFASWARAQTASAAGDTVYFRGGRYRYTAATTTCTSTSATVDAVVLNKSGTATNTIKYWAFPGETPVFDFSGINDTSRYNCRQVGVRVQANWLHLKGLELTGTLQLNNLNHESWCVYVNGGNNNLFEALDAHHNMGPGFFIQHGANNTFLNCDSHENEDTLTSNGDGQSADGFGCHPQAGDMGNIFRGCRAWWNSDDNWDFINAAEVCTVEYSWAWYAGYKPDALNGGAPVSLAAGNGNGFKGGGYGDPQTGVPMVPPQHIVRFDVSFYNKAAGVYANHEIVSPLFYNNTSFNNGVDYDVLGLNGTTVTSVGILRNNIAYSNNGWTLLANNDNAGPISDMFNSWDASLSLRVTDADFQAVAFKAPASCPSTYAPGGTPCCARTDMTCFAGMASARQADGSLPVLPFLRLAQTSALVDKGTNLGFAFVGKAPDLGAFELGGGGIPGSGGAVGTGGVTGAGGRGGGTGGAGGRAGTGGTSVITGSGGASSVGSGGRTGTGTGGAVGSTGGSNPTGTGGAPGATDGSASGGCSCRAADGEGGAPGAIAFSLVAIATVLRIQRRARRRP